MAKIAERMEQRKTRSPVRSLSAPLKWRPKRFPGKRGSVAILVAFSAPVLIGAIALGIEVSGWAAAEQQLQRTADAAALAAALTSINGSSDQVAATEGAYLAEINGAVGKSTMTWLDGTSVLSDNMITIGKVSGVVNASDVAFQATVKRTVPFLLSAIALTGPGKTLSATAVAEIGVASTGPQPCLFTTGGDVNGVTTGTDVTISGSVNLNMNGCSLRSDARVSLNGSINITAAAIYASGTITQSGSVALNNTPKYSGVPQMADPFANWSPVQNALSNAACSGGTAVTITSSGSTTLTPSCYSGINVSGSGSITLASGIYYVNGGINISGSVTVTGSDVTIISTGNFTSSGSVAITLTAPKSGTTAGIAYASTSSSGSSFSGSQAMNFSGLVYYPNGSLSFSGSAAEGSSGCAEVVAQSVTLSGSVNLASNCSTYGLRPYGSMPTASLVQ
jgi:Flp pilus assembly protein TadG